MKIVTPAAAVAALADDSLAIMPGGCARAEAFYHALLDDVTRFQALRLCSGFSFSPYTYLERGLGTHTRYVTWQASPALRPFLQQHNPPAVGFVPLRLGDVHRVVSRKGEIKPHAVVVQTSPPQADGTVSLGISVGPYLDFIDSAELVIAELNVNMPVTGGQSRVACEAIALAYEADTPLCEYPSSAPQERELRIIDSVLSLIPEGAWVQLGIGAVPDRITERLSSIRGIRLWSGLLTSGLQTFLEHTDTPAPVTVGELAGTREFYEFCHANPSIEMAPTAVTHDVARVGSLPRFISINSALEIDLQGQSNGEALGKIQVSGVGGSLDYIEAANLSPGGASIIAMTSTTNDGKRSKIVGQFPAGAVITTPRYCTDYVVTEFGVARLKGRDLYERAEALIAIAHPDFRDELAAALR